MKTLLVGYKAADLFERGKHGKKFTAKWLDENVLCHTLDIYHRHAIEKTHHIRAICSPHLPEGPWDLIKFKTGPKLMSGELSLDMLQEIHRLKPAKFELEFIGKERDKNDLLAKIRDNPERVRDFSAKWPASVPGGEKLMFTSYPGCFCHRRLDEGGLALAEIISRDLTSSPIPHSPFPVHHSPSLLDMGCGCGLVGFLVKSVVKDISLVMVDSHSRAVEAANVNAANFNMTAEIILADNGTPARMDGKFDVFAGNPPYYSDYRIAEVFLETAKRALKPGGVCYMVVKNDAGLRPVQERYFPNVEVIRRRGYCVLKSQKPM